MRSKTWLLEPVVAQVASDTLYENGPLECVLNFPVLVLSIIPLTLKR